ncbi:MULTISPECIES: FHA domain-containing protein [unclassified Coleofasciculus]|uniref:FHA domain-containing protein n=1 Tax=unclassified Coleofasciculus TaxID=2692782 RepID=UPI001881A578|nr:MULTISPECIES: FHA domain-containing protein [unclassified Coleofasciculus]MBE9129472.1 FHA domain-containing protein [Coleofasciculus sp. LEGE 07081]MBE9152068.1 FHA domain-containing protein [Coleofasciculus sp. LEGE 07092]
MHELTLEWQEARYTKTEIIRDEQPSKNPGTVRIGRDPARCDIVLSDPTVSGLHVEVFFNAASHAFVLRNLRKTNPPMVDGRQIPQGEVTLRQSSTICLGQVELKVVAVSIKAPNSTVPPTILIPPNASVPVNQPAPSAFSYGLECPSCHRISPYERMALGCQWCGTSLAAAASVLMTPNTYQG